MKKRKNYQLYLNAILCLILLLSLCIPLFHRYIKVIKYIGIFIVFMTILLVYTSLKITQSNYKNFFNKTNPGPLLIPKAYGVGITINPFHFLGKIFYFLFILFLIGLMIKMSLTPV